MYSLNHHFRFSNFLFRVFTMFLIAHLGLCGLTISDYKDHPCRRDCNSDKIPMHCQYNFTVEWYSAMSKACFQCPFNVSDCYRPHCVTADGFYKGVLTVNRMLPGPEIQVCEDDLVSVHLYNRMESSESTSIHWHGIHQRQHPYMDGVSMLTQCPINAGSLFLYRFTASPAGTHYYHAHAGLQRGDGFFGAFIVRQAKDPHRDLYDIDSYDHSMIVNDWMHELTLQKFSGHHHSGGDNKAKSMLINGRGAKIEFIDSDNSSKKAFTPYSRFEVEAGKRYRFRLISNAVLNCPIQITIDGHPMLLIASDGKPLQPYPTVNLILYSGERYDFVLEANQTVGNYFIRAAGLADCDGRFYGASQAAVLHYKGASDGNPTGGTDYKSMLNSGKVVNPFNQVAAEDFIPVASLRSLPQNKEKDPALREEADYKFFFGMDFMKVDNIHFHVPELYPLRVLERNKHLYSPQINNISHYFPASPMLSQPVFLDKRLLCNDDNTRNCSTNYCSCIHRHKISLGSVVEVIVVDEGVTFDASHPMHLHGYSFRVIGQAKVAKDINIETVKQMDKEGKLERNFDNPPIKDSVIVPDGGYTILRFYADNPGEWFFHCHLLFHSELGMGLVFSVGEQEDLPKLPKYFPQCGNYGPGYKSLSLRDTTSGTQQLYASLTLTLIIIMMSIIF